MKLPQREAFVQFIKFAIVGASNTLISLAIYYFFLWLDPSWYLWGNVVGWAGSVANAFFWSNRYVFANGERGLSAGLKKLGKTYLCYGATFLLSTLLLYLEVDMWRWSAVFSPLLNLLVTVPLNFLLNKFWAFR